jgi:N-acetylated-alpha-linked acidic dipeptidase
MRFTCLGLMIGLLSSLVISEPASAQVESTPSREPESRRLLREFTSQARLAGTSGSRWGASFVARELRRAGWEVEVDVREVLLSLPRRLEIQGYALDSDSTLLFQRTERFDPDARPPGEVPPFNAWSASGLEFAPVIDAGYGLRADFERLLEAGVEVEGTIALCRYGRSYRGVKAQLAEEFGCSAVLLFNDPSEDGAARGEVWPHGPWKPDWAVQRGSIAPMARAPGDPSTPGWPSGAPDEPGRRLSPEECDAALPGILCMPIPAREALELIANLELVELKNAGGEVSRQAIGPGPAHVQLGIDQPREWRTIENVIGYLPGPDSGLVIAGNHRDAWVRGAHDAGGGTVALLRCAQRLGERARLGWRPRNTISLAFWDAEETGLIGSTEWAEAHADELRRDCLVYINADAAVSGTLFRGAAGTPGLVPAMRAALERITQVDGTGNLWDAWVEASGESEPRLRLPGSGSDYTVFLHHLGLPIIDIALQGSSGGQYHTSFDDFAQVDRNIDPTWEGHELAGELIAGLLLEFAERGHESFDEAQAARRMAQVTRSSASWLGEEHSARLAMAFEEVAASASKVVRDPFYQRLQAPAGLPGRTWYRNRLWAPGLETGYASEIFPSLRLAQGIGPEALAFEVDSLILALKRESILR